MKTVLNGKTILPNIYTDETSSTKNIRIVKLYGLSYNNEASYYDTVFMYIPTFTSISTDQVSIRFNNADIGEVSLENQAMDAGKLYLIQFYEGEQYTGADNLTLTKLHAKVIKLSGSGGGSSIDGIDVSGMFTAASTFANDRFNLKLSPTKLNGANLNTLSEGIYVNFSQDSLAVNSPNNVQDFVLYVYVVYDSPSAGQIIQVLIDIENCIYVRHGIGSTSNPVFEHHPWKMVSGIKKITTKYETLDLETITVDGKYNVGSINSTDKPTPPPELSATYFSTMEVYTINYNKFQRFKYTDGATNKEYVYLRKTFIGDNIINYGDWIQVNASSSGSSLIFVPTNESLILNDLDVGIYVSDFPTFVIKTETATSYSPLATLDGRLTIISKYEDASDGDTIALYIDSNLNITALKKDLNDSKGWSTSSTLYAGTINFGYNIPSCSSAPSNNNHLVNKAYVDGLVGNINTLLDQLNGEVI